jgi:hypothetical protein
MEFVTFVPVRTIFVRLFLWMAVSVSLGQLSPAALLYAQNNGNNGAASGIQIDPTGMVSNANSTMNPALLVKRQNAFVDDNLGDDLKKDVPLRKVSLVKLTQHCAELTKAQQPFPLEVQYLYGLTQIDFLFVDHEQKDIVIAGPAGPFAPNHEGRMCQISSKRPVLRLDDLIVAMREAKRSNRMIGCSIDPIPENLAAMQREVQNTVPLSPDAVHRRFEHLATLLGKHTVRVDGIPAETHMALTLVEADYRMKRISIGMDPSQVKGLPSHLSLLKAAGNSMQRWWMIPFYDAIYTTPEHDAFEFTGTRVQLLSQDEISMGLGNRTDAATTKVSTEKWAQIFTERYGDLAKKSPVFAELQNVMDVIMVSYLLEQYRIPDQVQWDRQVFFDEAMIPTKTLPAPTSTMAIFNTKRVGQGMVIGLLSGGVTINPQETLSRGILKVSEERRLTSRRVDNLKAESNKGWWD